MTRHESTSLARIKMSNVTDWNVQLAYLVERESWEKALDLCQNHARDFAILLGHISSLALLPEPKKPNVVPLLPCQSETAVNRKRKAFEKGKK